MRHETRLAVDDAIGRGVLLVPRGEGRDDNAGIDQHHRRVRSSVWRTISAGRVGKFSSATATGPWRRRSSRMLIGAIATCRRPSLISSSNTWPGCTPISSRRRLGTTIRPAESMVVLMAEYYHEHATRAASLCHGPCAAPGSD